MVAATGAVALAVALLAGPAPAASATDGWTWPLSPRPQVVGLFRPPDSPWGAGDRGVDLAGSVGQPVAAIGPGIVTFAANLAGRGVVVVRHGSLRSTYEPVAASVRVGQSVAAGQTIGLTAIQSHCAPAACLHLGVLMGTQYLDPLALLGPVEVRLKPLDGRPRIDGPGAFTPASLDLAVRSFAWTSIR